MKKFKRIITLCIIAAVVVANFNVIKSFAATTKIDTKQIYSIYSVNSNKALDVEYGYLNSGANIIQWDYHGGNNQQWKLKDIGNGYYSVISVNSGKVLDVTGGSNKAGANVIQWDYHGGKNQLWKLKDVGKGYYALISAQSGKALDVCGASLNNAANVIQWDYHGGKNQLWKVVKSDKQNSNPVVTQDTKKNDPVVTQDTKKSNPVVTQDTKKSNPVVTPDTNKSNPVVTPGNQNGGADGKFDTFKQGYYGDCGAVSAIQALENSQYGRNLLKNMITYESNGSYTLNWGSGKVNVTKEEVNNSPLSGDIDAKVIEAALLKKGNWGFSYQNFVKFTGFGENRLYGNNNKEAIFNYMVENTQSGKGIIAACDFNWADSNKGILGNGSHSYSIVSVDKNKVIVCNPHNTSSRIELSADWFKQAIRYFCVVNESTRKVDYLFQ